MIQIRKASDRGKTELGWLHSQHTFSFGEFYDTKQMGFRSLRVINDDRWIASDRALPKIEAVFLEHARQHGQDF